MGKGQNWRAIPANAVFSSDGLKHYFYALTAHFGKWVNLEGESKPSWMVLSDFVYAQVIKMQRRFRLVNVESRFVGGLPSEYFSRLKSVWLSGGAVQKVGQLLFISRFASGFG